MPHGTKPLVEVAARTGEGRVPLGIMNTGQALDLPEELDVEISHPDKEAGATDHFIGRDELRKVGNKPAARRPAGSKPAAAKPATRSAAAGKAAAAKPASGRKGAVKEGRRRGRRGGRGH